MTFGDFFMRLFGKKSRFALSEADYAAAAADYAANETAVRELALNAAAGLIAGAVSRCKFKTYSAGAEVKDDEYYLWNVRPNPNESAAQFIRKWVYRLCCEGECLIVFTKADADPTPHEHAFVADTFVVETEKALFGNTYSGVSINGLALNKKFSADDVLHYRLDSNARRLVDLFYGSYRKAIDFSLRAFSRSRGERGVFETEAMPPKMELEEYNHEVQNDLLKPYFSADNAVLPIFKGQKYTRTNSTGQREMSDAADTRKLINDVFDMTALAFGIPPALLRGEMADASQLLTNFLTFCIGPMCRMLADEMNAKRYRKERYLDGDYLEIDTSCIKHFDLLDAATAADKLISSGAVSINELRVAIGKPPVSEEWGARHWMTRNYALIDALVAVAPATGEEVKQD